VGVLEGGLVGLGGSEEVQPLVRVGLGHPHRRKARSRGMALEVVGRPNA